MAIQTRGQITLLSKPDVTISMTPELITIPVNSNGELIDSLSFTETIAIQAKDSKGRTLYFESINIDETGESKNWLSQVDLVEQGLLEIIQEVPGDETSPIIGYRYFFKRTKEQVKEELNSTGFINFGFVMENKLDIADDDFSDYRTISYIKAKSGQDGIPAYSVDIAGEQQVFVRTINPDGTYSYEPETITLTAIPINFEGSSFEPYYRWFKYGTEGTYLQEGQGDGANELEISPNLDGYGVGVYVCEIYRSFSNEIEDSPIARDYASIGMATNGIDNYTVSLTNDNAVVTVDNLQYALEDGTVSTGIVVYKGANKINPNDYSIEIEDETDGEVKFSAILNTEDSNNSFWEVQASYKKGKYVGAIGEFIIKVGGMDFKKRFQVSPSLMGGTSRLIKISGQQYFRINQDGNSYTPNDITLTAHLSNVEFLRWEYQNPKDKDEWPTIANASLSLDVNFNDIYWQEDNIAKFRAVAAAENIEYYDEYTVYKFKEGQNSINVIASNENVNIITDIFGKIDSSIDNTVETIYFTVFNGSDASTDITIPMDKIEIISDSDVSSMINVSSQSNALEITITRDDDKVFTPTTIKVELSNGATKTISLVPLQQGLSARTLTIYGNQVFKYSNSTTGEIKYNPSQITVHAQHQNIEGYSWYYRIGDGPNQDLTIAGDSYSFTPSNFSGWLADQILTIGVKEKNPPVGSTAITDEITIHQAYDGSNGKDSSLVLLNNPTITVTEDSEGKLVRETFKCEVLGITGNENVRPTGISWSNKPEWITITLSESILQLVISDNYSASNIKNRQGSITIYTVTPINTSLQLNWTVIRNGKDGQNGIDYALTPSQAVLRKDANSGISPSELTFSATIKEGSELAKPLNGYIECYSSTDGENFSSVPIKTNIGSSLIITANANWAAIKGKLYKDSSKEILLDEQTVIVIESSSASFVASLDNEYIPVVCDADGKVLDNDGNLGTCKITAYLNGVEITDYSTNLSVNTEEGSISYVGPDSNGQITISSLTSDKAKIKFTVTQTINNTSTEIYKYLKVEKIKGGRDAPETETLIHYQASNNGTLVPNGTWYSSISDTGIQQGQFLWTRTTLHYKNGEKEDIISYSVSRYGLDGEPGKTMTRVINYYAASTSSSVAPTSGWKTDPMKTTFSSVNKYLWNYERIYSNDTLLSTTNPTVISVYGDTGATIASITETYKASKSDQDYSYPGYSYTPNFVSTVAASGFNSVYKYLWNIEKFYDKDGNLLAESPARVIGVYGNDGKTIVSITSYYIENISGSIQPTLPVSLTELNGWSLTASLSDPNYFIWTIDYLLYNDNSFSFTNARLDLGTRSDKVAQGMYNGTFKLSQLVGATMTNATINKTDGLIIEGIDKKNNNATYKLEANSNSLGIYRNNVLKFGTYTDNAGEASILLKGTIYADRGKIGTLNDTDDDDEKIGWTILGSEKDENTNVYSPAAIHSGGRNSLTSTEKGIYIGTDGISFSGTNNSTKPNLLFSYIEEEDDTTRGSLSVDVLTVSNLILENKLGGGDIEGLAKESFGIFSGDAIPSSTVATDSKNGDIYVKYSSEIATQEENTEETEVSVTVSNGGTAIPSIQRYFTGARYHGTYANWNGWKDSSSHSNNTGIKYIKIGRNNSGATLGAFRGSFKTSMSGSSNTGVTSATSFTLSITGSYKPFKSYDTENYTSSSGILKALIFDSGTATVPVASGIFNLNYSGGDGAREVTLKASMTGQIISGKTYYITIQGSTGNLFYIIPGTIDISGTTKTIAVKKEPFTPELYIKSANSWVPVASSMWVIAGTRSPEDAGQTTPDCGPETYSDDISWTAISGERAWNIHYSSSLTNDGNPGLAKYQKLISDNGGKPGAITIPSNGIYSINFSFYLSRPNTNYRRFCAAILRNGFGGQYKLNANGVITREGTNIDCAVSWTGPLNENDRIYFGTYTDGNLTSVLDKGTSSAFNYSLVRLGTLA